MKITDSKDEVMKIVTNWLLLQDRGYSVKDFSYPNDFEEWLIVYLNIHWERMLRVYPDVPTKVWHVEPIRAWIKKGYASNDWILRGLFETHSEVNEYLNEQSAWMLIQAQPNLRAKIKRQTEKIHKEIKHNHVSLALRYKILKRDNFHCQLCGRGVDDGVKLEIDHKLPKSLGGLCTYENLWTLCFDCNRGKSNKDKND